MHLCNTRQHKTVNDYNNLTASLMAAGLNDKGMTVAGIKAEQLENILHIAVHWRTHIPPPTPPPPPLCGASWL